MEELKKRLQEEIAALEYELRNELPKEILRARAHGDLRENAEFHAAKERQRFVDARLSQLKQRLGEVALVDVNKIPCWSATISALVTGRENSDIVVAPWTETVALEPAPLPGGYGVRRISL